MKKMNIYCIPLQAEFNTEKQSKFKSALAIASGTTVDTVEIISISDVRRRQGQGIKVESKVALLFSISLCFSVQNKLLNTICADLHY
jgi:hypothetical protein